MRAEHESGSSSVAEDHHRSPAHESFFERNSACQENDAINHEIQILKRGDLVRINGKK